MDPERLIHSGSDEEAALLRSAVREGPSPASRAQTLAALGVATGVIAAATTTTAAAAAASGQLAAGGSSIAGTGFASIAPGFASIAKWLGIGIASTAVVVGGAYQARESLHDAGYLGTPPGQTYEANSIESGREAAPQIANAPAAKPAAEASDPSLDETPAEESAPEGSTAEEAIVAHAPLAASPVAPSTLNGKASGAKVLDKAAVASVVEPAKAKSKTAPVTLSAPTVAPGASSLAAEVASLDAARAALASGEAQSAHALLQAHEGQFKTGLLGPEAQVLAIEVLAQSGQYEKAIARAEAFLATNPASPHRARVQSVAASCRAALANASP